MWSPRYSYQVKRWVSASCRLHHTSTIVRATWLQPSIPTPWLLTGVIKVWQWFMTDETAKTCLRHAGLLPYLNPDSHFPKGTRKVYMYFVGSSKTVNCLDAGETVVVLEAYGETNKTIMTWDYLPSNFLSVDPASVRHFHNIPSLLSFLGVVLPL